MARLLLRVELDSEARLSGDTIGLLERVETEGSISAAGRAHGITYRRAWTVLDELLIPVQVEIFPCSGGLNSLFDSAEAANRAKN